jgi:hypothetical protein
MGAAAPVQDAALDAQVLGSPRQTVEATGLEVPLDRANLLSTHRNTECKQTRNAARRQITPRNTHFSVSRRCATGREQPATIGRAKVQKAGGPGAGVGSRCGGAAAAAVPGAA